MIMKKRILFLFYMACIVFLWGLEDGAWCTENNEDVEINEKDKKTTENIYNIDDDDEVIKENILENDSQQFGSNNETIKFPSKFYAINEGAYADENWYKIRNSNQAFTDDKERLHIFAFNVGEGNCVILRKGNEAVIIDASYGEEVATEKILPKIQAVLAYGKENKKTQNEKKEETKQPNVIINAILTTHPGEKRNRLIDKIMKSDSVTAGKPLYINDSELFTEKNVTVSKITTDKKYNILNNCTFDFTKVPRRTKKTKSKEIKEDFLESQLIRVTYSGKTILFTGDEEGSLPEEIGYVEDDSHLKLLCNYLEKVKKAPKKCNNLVVANKTSNKLSDISVAFLLPQKTPPASKKSEILSESKWARLLSSSNGQVIWFLSSIPEGTRQMPTRSFYEACPLASETPHHKPHAIYYQGEYEDEIRYKFTEKPLYVTGAAPGGVYWLRILGDNKNDPIEFYDAYPKLTKTRTNLLNNKIKYEERGWKNIAPVKIGSFKK